MINPRAVVKRRSPTYAKARPLIGLLEMILAGRAYLRPNGDTMTQAFQQTATPDGSATTTLTRDEIQRATRTFADVGYVVFPNVVSKERLSHLRARIMEEFERSSGSGGLFSGGGLISGHLNCFPGEESRFAYRALEEHGIIDVIKSLFPRSLNAVRVGCNLNLPGSVAQHYHADGPFTEDFLIANVAVVDTDLANGAIDVLPRTHRKFYKFWRYAVERAYSLTKRIPMKQGDVLIRTSNLWHRGMPNQTTNARPMLAFTFGEKGAHLDDPFGADDGKITFKPNWYRTDFVGRLRERTFVAAPITYSAYRFARSLVGNKGYSDY